jgi:hypothetical protein
MMKYFGLLLVFYLFIQSIYYGYSGYYQICTILIGIYFWIGAKTIEIAHRKLSSTRILLGLLIIGGAFRLLWAVFVPTLPVDDFQYYHENALILSQNTTALTKNIGYSLMLSTGYRILPDVLTGKIINAIASTISILLIYLVGSKLINQFSGLVAALIFTVFPSEILMVSVLGTEVFATTLGLIIAFFLFRTSAGAAKINYSIFWAGLFFGLGLTIRSSLLFYFPAVVLWLLLKNSGEFKQTLKTLFTLLAGIATGLSIVIVYYSFIAGRITLEPFGIQDSFPLLSGTNTQIAGQWNQEDADLFSSWPDSQRDALARQEALQRIKSNPIGFVLSLPKKFYILMGPNDYGILWSLKTVDWGEGNLFGIHATDGNNWKKYQNLQERIFLLSGLLSQSFYIAVLFFAICAYINYEKNPLVLIAIALILSTLIPHIVLEVQSRYHHYIMPFVILLASLGIERMEPRG